MNLLYSLRRAGRYFGDRIACYREHDTLTYAHLIARAYQGAAALRKLGVNKGDRVAVLMLNSPEYVELFYSCLIAEAVIVPINTRWSVADVAFAINDSSCAALVVDDRFLPNVREIRQLAPCLQAVLFTGIDAAPSATVRYEDALTAADRDAYLWGEAEAEDLAGLFYTSGTTGGPKGVMLTHRNILANTLNMLAGQSMEPDRVWLHVAPLFHLADNSMLHVATFCGRANAFLAQFEPEATLRAIEKYRVTDTVLVPAMLNAVINCQAIDRYDVSSLRHLFYGASPTPLTLLERARQRFNLRFRQGYGMTECSPVLTLLEPEDHVFEEAADDFARIKSVGRPAIGVELRVVDSQDRDMPPGEAGEIVARGDVVMKGYWNRPEITAEALRGGWMHTGDIGVLDERGYLHLRDRKKDMIKPGGENVYSPEVEATIVSHPAVLEAAVIGVPDPKWMEGIRAIVVVREGMALREEELIEFCRARMAHFKCPGSVMFTNALPKGGTGKVQKTELRAQFGN